MSKERRQKPRRKGGRPRIKPVPHVAVPLPKFIGAPPPFSAQHVLNVRILPDFEVSIERRMAPQSSMMNDRRKVR